MPGRPKRRAKKAAAEAEAKAKEEARQLGISPARLAVQRAREARESRPPLREPHPKTLEARDPDAAAEIIAGVTQMHPMLRPVAQAAEQLGLSPDLVKGLLRRVRTDYLPLHDALEMISSDSLEKLFGNSAEMILRSITFEDIENAGLRDKMVSAGIALDKRNLLRGLPTERISIEDREALSRLLPIIEREARRREVEIDVTPGANSAVAHTKGPEYGHVARARDEARNTPR